MAKRSSSRRWLREHESDPYVRQARQANVRSRAYYKLEQLQRRDRILAAGMKVVDLGAAPGGWSSYARECIGPAGRVVALDVLPMEPLPGVEFIRGDFREETVLQKLEQIMGGEKFDLVLSDMAPNMSGIATADQARSMHLAELTLDFAAIGLKDGGNLVTKAFQGEGFDEFLRKLRASFSRVVVRKPDASRSRSRELYLLARSYGIVR